MTNDEIQMTKGCGNVSPFRFRHSFVIGYFVILHLPLTLVVLACGCTGRGPEWVKVQGRVTYQGEPMEQAEIRFVPVAGTEAPVRTAMVRDGRFKASGRGALALGTYRIEITAYRGGSPPDGPAIDPYFDRDSDVQPRVQFLPEKFNTRTEIEPLEVPEGSRSITRDFDLTL